MILEDDGHDVYQMTAIIILIVIIIIIIILNIVIMAPTKGGGTTRQNQYDSTFAFFPRFMWRRMSS